MGSSNRDGGSSADDRASWAGRNAVVTLEAMQGPMFVSPARNDFDVKPFLDIACGRGLF